MRNILFFVLLFFATQVYGAVEFGVGLNSATSGRYIPTLTGGFGGATWALTGSSSGVRSNYYYYSTYSLSFFRVWKSGDFFWGDMTSGFGLGAFYTEREFRDEYAAPIRDQDVGVGPAFRVRWFPVGAVYLNLEFIFGLRELFRFLTLNGQNYVIFTLGFEL